MKPVFPIEILEYSTEQHRYTYLKKHKIIYAIILLGLLSALIALPFIRIDLYKTSPGLIRTEKETSLMTSQIDGKVNMAFNLESDSIQQIKGFETSIYPTLVRSLDGTSPQTDLVVECYMSPSEMTLIKKDQEVKFRIDAFKQRRWGLASGHIIRVYEDLVKINNLPMYRILCSIDETSFFLNNTTKVNLQKGMALTVRFFLEKRSLLQLLFDKLQD